MAEAGSDRPVRFSVCSWLCASVGGTRTAQRCGPPYKRAGLSNPSAGSSSCHLPRVPPASDSVPSSSLGGVCVPGRSISLAGG